MTFILLLLMVCIIYHVIYYLHDTQIRRNLDNINTYLHKMSKDKSFD
jgi:hypothetical protein